jgi:hypothetical protein
MKFRKKPVMIEAIQFMNCNKAEIEEFVGKSLEQTIESEEGVSPIIISLFIPTLEGAHKAMPGDMIIKGVKGEFYPCKPDIFAMTYEPIQE